MQILTITHISEVQKYPMQLWPSDALCIYSFAQTTSFTHLLPMHLAMFTIKMMQNNIPEFQQFFLKPFLEQN